MASNPNPKAKIEKTANKAAVAAPTEPKLTGIEKAKKRREDLAKIIAYAAYKISREPKAVDEKGDAEIAELKNLCAAYAPKAKRPQPGKEPTWSRPLRDIFKGEVMVHENRLWNDLKYGRESMSELIRNATLREKPAFRFWVKFDKESGNYRVLGEGEKAPEGWVGKLPKDQATSDIKRLHDAEDKA
jgi:hypothetical protein